MAVLGPVNNMEQSTGVGPKEEVFKQFSVLNQGKQLPASQGDSAKSGSLAMQISSKDNGGTGDLPSPQGGM